MKNGSDAIRKVVRLQRISATDLKLLIRNGLKMKKILIIPMLFVFLTSCQAKYLTPEGERLVKNVATGCVLGEIFFEDCKAGAAVTGAATVIDGQN